MTTPRNMSELADIVEKAIREQDQVEIVAVTPAEIRKIAVSIARHGSRYARHAKFTDSARRVSKVAVLSAGSVVSRRATQDLRETGLLLSTTVWALASFAARWFLEWLLRRLENRDAVAAIAAGEAAWVSTESPGESGE